MVTYSWTGLPDGDDWQAPVSTKHRVGEHVTVDTIFVNTSEIEVGDDLYRFSGWATLDLENFNGVSFEMPNGPVTFTGTWVLVEPNTYTIHFDCLNDEIEVEAEDGYISMPDDRVETIRSDTYCAYLYDRAMRSNYVFKGWSYLPDRSTVDFVWDDDAWTFSPDHISMSSERNETTLYPVWEPEIFNLTVKFMAYGYPDDVEIAPSVVIPCPAGKFDLTELSNSIEGYKFEYGVPWDLVDMIFADDEMELWFSERDKVIVKYRDQLDLEIHEDEYVYVADDDSYDVSELKFDLPGYTFKSANKDLIGTAKYGTTILFTYFSECQHSLTYTPEIGPEGNLYSGGPVWTHNYYCSKCGLSGSAKCSNTSSHDHGGSPTWYTNTTTCKLCGRSATEGYQYGSGYWSNGYFSRSDQQIGNAGYKATGFIVRYVRRGSTGNDYWLTVPEINSVSNIQVSVNGRVLPFTTAYQFSGRDLIVKLVDPIILYPGDRISISLYAPNPSSEPNAALDVSSLSGY